MYACWKTVWWVILHFYRSDAVDESWTYFDKIRGLLEEAMPETPLYGYPAGTWGPKEAVMY